MTLHELVSGNQFVSGGMLLMAAGWALAQLRFIPRIAWGFIRGLLVYTVEIDNIDPSFNWIKAWLSAKSKTKWVNASSANRGGMAKPSASNEGRDMPTVHYTPRNLCTVKHNGRRIISWMTKTEVQNTIEFRQTITLQSWFASRSLFESVMSDAFRQFGGRDGKTVEVWVPASWEWMFLDRKPIRSRDSLILPGGVWESVVDDAKLFLSRREWYREKGIPWRRGYLFYGPPGSGKSSLAHALASELKTDLNTLSIASVSADDGLVSLMSKVQPGNILLMEDIDTSKSTRENDANGVSLSGLLNGLDGIAARDGQIVIMTTNHIERLDPALIRPGRADVRVHIGEATEDQARRMFLRFFDRTDLAASFGRSWSGKSMASIQEHLLRHEHSAESAASGPVSLAA